MAPFCLMELNQGSWLLIFFYSCKRQRNFLIDYYLVIRVNVAIKSFNLVSTLTRERSNLQVLFPWMPETKAAVSRFPCCKICLQ